jgi:hypothetical protein
MGVHRHQRSAWNRLAHPPEHHHARRKSQYRDERNCRRNTEQIGHDPSWQRTDCVAIVVLTDN